MSVLTPNWSDAVVLLANQTLARAATVRTTQDWRTKRGGYIFVRLARGGTNALTTGVVVQARKVINGAGAATAQILHPGPLASFLSLTAAAVGTTCAASGNNAAAGSLAVASTTSFAAGDLIYLDGAGSGNKEWCRVAAVTDSTHLLLDAPLQNAHNSVSDTVRNKAEAFQFWLDGGSYVELMIDYGASTTGDTLTLQADAQTYDSDTAT